MSSAGVDTESAETERRSKERENCLGNFKADKLVFERNFLNPQLPSGLLLDSAGRAGRPVVEREGSDWESRKWSRSTARHC